MTLKDLSGGLVSWGGWGMNGKLGDQAAGDHRGPDER